MTATSAAAGDHRVLLLALTARDAETTQELLQDVGVEVTICSTLDALLTEASRGAAALAIAEEFLSLDGNARLASQLREQPAWSDLPVLLLTRQGANSEAVVDAMHTLGNITLLERPLRVGTLMSAVRTAVRARDRQYQIRGHLEQQERAAEALRAADRRKDEFLATLGHELRNPLAPLLTGLHLLRLVDVRDARLSRVTDIMERQVTHLVRLVDDLLEVSRITRGTIEIGRDPLDVATLVRSAVDTTRSMFEASRHELVVELPDEPITVVGDAVRLTQVLTNLLTNAAKYTNSDGRIAITARRVQDRVLICVRDNGIGIPASHIDSVFEMFMQVDRFSRRVQGGLGIGLTLVRSLVEMHGGTVQARSAGSDAGSEFIVTLPALAANAAPKRTVHELGEFPARRILVVDDNHDAADSLGSLLRELGATVAVEYGGDGALAALGHFKPDAVLLDIGMPEMDGYEVARRIRDELDGKAPQLIALTGWGQDRDHRRSQLAGFDHHLVKPPNIEHLRSLLREG